MPARRAARDPVARAGRTVHVEPQRSVRALYHAHGAGERIAQARQSQLHLGPTLQ